MTKVTTDIPIMESYDIIKEIKNEIRFSSFSEENKIRIDKALKTCFILGYKEGLNDAERSDGICGINENDEFIFCGC